MIAPDVAVGGRLPSRCSSPWTASQENHLKAYGLTYWALEQYGEAEWLLNYRGGSFLLPNMEGYTPSGRPPRHHHRDREWRRHRRNPSRDRRFQYGDCHLGEGAQGSDLYAAQQRSVGTTLLRWRSSTRRFRTRPFGTRRSFEGGLDEYEWLHLHHEDFTGQFSKFFITYAGTVWLQEEVSRNEEMAERLGVCHLCPTSRRASPDSFASTWRTADSCWPCVRPPRPSNSHSVLNTRTSRPRMRTARRPIRTPRAKWSGISRWLSRMVCCRPAASVNAFSDIDAHQVNTPWRLRTRGVHSLRLLSQIRSRALDAYAKPCRCDSRFLWTHHLLSHGPAQAWRRSSLRATAIS